MVVKVSELVHNVVSLWGWTYKLHTHYTTVTMLKELSGLGGRYTTELGMNIGVAEQSVWSDYIKVCHVFQ